VAAVVDQLGMCQPRYSFRTGVVVHASTEMAMFNALQTLALGNDTTGATELVLPVQLAGLPMRALAALIQAMLWYVADLPKRFAPHLVCELPGIGERRAGAPFWHALGRHFHAGVLPVDHDLFAGDERGAIGRLMPKHTLYSALLSDAAQSCIGLVSPSAAQLHEALSAHGFRFGQHLNMFDAGPILEGQIGDLRGLVLPLTGFVRVVDRLDHRSAQRCCLRRSDNACASLWVASAQIEGETVAISADSARALALGPGQCLRVVACL
jgi:arginine N-succinyltransferase